LAASERQFDVVVFGATGITGRQVAKYLAGTGASWAAAGRDAAKVASTLGGLGVTAPEVIVADVSDPASLREMAARARVVLHLAGPYTIRGRPVIAACVEAGSHYMDLTGEIPFVREILDEFDEAAREAGVKVVQVSGFESLPPDLAVLLAADTARERWGEELADVDLTVRVRGPRGMPRPSDWISGGTFQSMAEVVGSEHPELAADPAALIDDPGMASAVRARSPIVLAPRRDARGAVIGPMAPAAFINPAVIHRTAALAAAERGDGFEPFRYREGVAIGGHPVTLPARYAAAAAMSGTQAMVRVIARSRPPFRARAARTLRSALPSSGFGPSGERLADWWWKIRVEARTTGSHELAVEAEASGHPGYLATARMLGEAGLMLAEPGLTPDRSGCLTPALALGTSHLERFERAELRFSVK
jgi:short subunit dehydrogenase-like uncharacterized protein